MPKAIYVNLAVADLRRSINFFEALGFSFDRRFSNDQAAALVVSDTIFAMLHVPDSLRRFTKKEIADSSKTTEAILALEVEDRAGVDDLMEKALKSGGREQREAEDYGFMYGRAFEDPDGHIWEAFWMDPSRMPEA